VKPVNNTYIQDLLVVNGGVLVCLLLIWGRARAVRAGRPLTTFQKKMIWYSFFFIIGMAYLMMFGSWLHLPPVEWFIAAGVWGVSLAGVVWVRHARKRRLRSDQRGGVAMDQDGQRR
jgi:hypothetical protein